MMLSNLVSITLLSLFSATSPRAEDPLKPLDFLVGSWLSSAPDASGGDVFARELGGEVLIRQSTSASRGPSRDGTGTLRGLMTIYPSADHKGLRAVYFDSVGHVIHYQLADVQSGRRVQLISDGTDPGPMFRLTYQLAAPKLLHVTFESAMPGQKDGFSVIAEGDEDLAP